MFNDPGWASKEEWDAYAWFGFAPSEAQTVEMLLLVLATALIWTPCKELRSEIIGLGYMIVSVG